MANVVSRTMPIDEDGEPFGTAGNPFVVSGAPAGAATIVDGGSVAVGAIADAAATAGGTGTVSAKLRTATAQLAALGAVADAADLTPAADSTMIALLKGILTQNTAILAILTDVHNVTDHSFNTTAIT